MFEFWGVEINTSFRYNDYGQFGEWGESRCLV